MKKVQIVTLGLISVFISLSLLLVSPAYPDQEKSVNERIVKILKERGILKGEEYEEQISKKHMQNEHEGMAGGG